MIWPVARALILLPLVFALAAWAALLFVFSAAIEYVTEKTSCATN
jgi:hypothetical protein